MTAERHDPGCGCKWSRHSTVGCRGRHWRRNGWTLRWDRCHCMFIEPGVRAVAIKPHAPQETGSVKAAALREFADAHRFPSHWIMFRRDDGSGVTVSDLLRETANRLEGETDDA